MSLHYWVIEEELAADLDTHLLDSVLSWVDQAWPFASVSVLMREENQRGIQVASDLGLTLSSNLEVKADHVSLVWHRER